jgi:hypothetical protein
LHVSVNAALHSPSPIPRPRLSRAPEFAAIWEKEAPALFAQVFADFKKGFSRNELTANLTAQTPLLTRYESESASVLAHLHLMAIQKHVYLKLGRADLLAWIGKLYPLIGGDEGRAWEIVNTLEGHEAFIEELKSAEPTSR